MSESTWPDRLREFVERWYEHPLSEEDGEDEEAIDEGVEEVGAPIPGARAGS